MGLFLFRHFVAPCYKRFSFNWLWGFFFSFSFFFFFFWGGVGAGPGQGPGPYQDANTLSLLITINEVGVVGGRP